MRGRPPKYKERTQSLHLKLPDSLVRELERVSDDTNLSLNELVIEAVSKFIGKEEGIRAYSQEIQQLKAHIEELNKPKEDVIVQNRPLTPKEDRVQHCVRCGKISFGELCIRCQNFENTMSTLF